MTEPKAYITTTNYAGFNFVEMLLGIKEESRVSSRLLPSAIIAPKCCAVPGSDQQNEGHNLVNTEANNITANDIFTICWTSGTEAEPKGVLEFKLMDCRCPFCAEAAELEPAVIFLSPFPSLIWVPSLFSSIGFDGRSYASPSLQPTGVSWQIKEEQIQLLFCPAVLNMLLQNKTLLESIDFRTIKSIDQISPLSD